MKAQKKSIIRLISFSLGLSLGVSTGGVWSATQVNLHDPIALDQAGNLANALDQGLETSSEKLTLGLETLVAEYAAFQAGVLNQTVITETFVPRQAFATINTEDKVLIDAVAADSPEQLASDIEALDGVVTGIAGRLVSAWLPLDRLAELETVAALQFARPSVSIALTGAVTSQGDTAQASDSARSSFGVDGTGSVIGVLSDSFNCKNGYATDVGTGDLPADVVILQDYTVTGCSDEGRAMAQIIHDVAPGADITYQTAFNGEAAFAQGILSLAQNGADIIVDDVYYYAEPMFQDGVIAQAIDTVVAQGIPYFSAAGNSGRQAYQGAFNSSGLTGYKGGVLHDFDPGPGVDTRLGLSQVTKGTYVLQWSDPYFTVSGAPGAATDLEICIYSPPGNATPALCSAYNNTGGDPLQWFNVNGTAAVEITVEKRSGPDPELIKIGMWGTVSFTDTYAGTKAGTLLGHANAAGANAVGAAAYFLTPAFGKSPPILNYFSSAGNTPILFDTAGAEVNVTREKPEFTAPDGGNNTFFGSDYEGDGKPNFFGTSAAAPHAAAVATLMRDADPDLTPAAIRAVLQNTAIDMVERVTGSFSGTKVAIGAGFDNDSGQGLIDAYAAVASVMAPTLSISDASQNEGNSGTTKQTFTVTLSQASDATVTVNYATADGTATAGSDYTTATGALTFTPGQTSKTLTVTVAGDTAVEADETFFVNLSDPVGADLADHQGQGTLLNDDSYQLRINDVATTEGNTGSRLMTFTVTLNSASPTDVAVDYATTDSTATTADNDYTASSGRITIPAGLTYTKFTVTLIGDLHPEPNETFTVTLSNPSGALLADAQGVGTILNDDGATLRISDVTVVEGDSGTTTAALTVSLSAPSDGVSVGYATANGTARAGSDYTATSGTLLFGPDETAKTIAVDVSGDSTAEANEYFVVNLSNPSNATLLDSQGVGRITNDDGLVLTIQDATVTEGDNGTGYANFTVTLDGSGAGAASVNYATANGTARAGSDYTAVSGTLTFAGPGSQTISVPIAGETLIEADETLYVNLSLAAGATLLDSQALGTIVNDDSPMLKVNDVSLSEGQSGTKNLTFTVTKSAKSLLPVTVAYATVDGSAKAGEDYTHTAGTLTFLGSETVKTVTVPISGDTTQEVNETFFLSLANLTNALLGDAQGMGQILTDDGPTLSINDIAVQEGPTGEAQANFTVTLSPASNNSLNVRYHTQDATAIAGEDYTATSGTLTFAPGQTSQTVTVTTLGDGVAEANESFYLLLTAPDFGSTTRYQGEAFLINDD